MKAGRELDRLISYKVFGRLIPNDSEIYTYPNYSTNIADAWLVVEKLKKKGIFLSVIPQIENYTIYAWSNIGESDKYNTYPVVNLEAETAPLAICLAALKCMGVDNDGSME